METIETESDTETETKIETETEPSDTEGETADVEEVWSEEELTVLFQENQAYIRSVLAAAGDWEFASVRALSDSDYYELAVYGLVNGADNWEDTENMIEVTFDRPEDYDGAEKGTDIYAIGYADKKSLQEAAEAVFGRDIVEDTDNKYWDENYYALFYPMTNPFRWVINMDEVTVDNGLINVYYTLDCYDKSDNKESAAYVAAFERTGDERYPFRIVSKLSYYEKEAETESEKETQAQSTSVILVSDVEGKLNIRSEAAHNSDLVGSIEDPSEELYFLGEVDQGEGSDGEIHDWYYITTAEGLTGWVRSDLVKIK